MYAEMNQNPSFLILKTSNISSIFILLVQEGKSRTRSPAKKPNKSPKKTQAMSKTSKTSEGFERPRKGPWAPKLWPRGCLKGTQAETTGWSQLKVGKRTIDLVDDEQPKSPPKSLCERSDYIPDAFPTVCRACQNPEACLALITLKLSCFHDSTLPGYGSMGKKHGSWNHEKHATRLHAQSMRQVHPRMDTHFCCRPRTFAQRTQHIASNSQTI